MSEKRDNESLVWSPAVQHKLFLEMCTPLYDRSVKLNHMFFRYTYVMKV